LLTWVKDYMQLESGGPPATTVSPWAALTGYDKIALAVVRSIHSTRWIAARSGGTSASGVGPGAPRRNITR
jgi:hypothetical protein